MLLADLASFADAFNLLLFECREPDDDSFRLHRLEFVEIDVANPLGHNSMFKSALVLLRTWLISSLAN